MKHVTGSFIVFAAHSLAIGAFALIGPVVGHTEKASASGIVNETNSSSETPPVTGSLISASDAFHFLEPLAPKAGDPTKFDASLLNYLSVEICEVNGSECPVVKTFTAQGPTSEQLRIGTSRDGSFYIVNWDTQKFDLAQKTYRVRVIVADLELGSIDLPPATYAKFGRTWPIKFLIEKNPAIRARVLRFLGKSCSQIASALKTEFNLTADDTALLLASDQEPCSAQEIDIALKGVFQDAVIPDTTKISDEATRNALISFDPETGRLIFSTETPLLKKLNIGDVLVSEPSTAAPYGYLRKVTSIGKARGQVILETVQAKLTEAITKGTLEASGELLPSGGSPANTFSAAKAQQSEAFTINSLDEGQQFNFQKDIDVTIDLAASEGDVEGTGTVRVQGSVYFNAGYNLGLGIEGCFEIPPVCVDRVEAWMGVEQKSRLKVTGQFDGELKKEQVIQKVPLDPIVFFIGPVPIVLVPSINIVLGVGGKAHIDFSFEAEAVSKIKVGAKWTDPDDEGRGWEDLSEFNPLSNAFVSADITGTIEVEAYGKVDAKLLLYGVFGPGFNGRLGIGAKGQIGSKPLWRVFAHVTSEVNVSADVGGFFDIGEIWSHQILNEYFDIKEADNVAPQCDFSTDTIQAEIGVPKTLGPRSGFEGHFECTDPEGESITYSAISSNSGDGVNGAIPLRYAFQSSGLRTITVTARDASGGTKTFALSVDVHNSLPIVTISAGSTVQATVQFFVAAEAYDPDTGIFLGCNRFNWFVTAPDTVTVLNDGGTCNAVVVFGQEGVRTVTVTATDQYGGVGSNSISVNVTPAPTNRPPVIDFASFSIRAYTGPGDDRSCIGLGGTFCTAPDGSFLFSGIGQPAADEYVPPLYMKVRATDPEGDPIHYEWRCESGTVLANITDEGDGEYSCTPAYATNNGIPVPIKVYAIVSDGINPGVETVRYTYHYRVRPN